MLPEPAKPFHSLQYVGYCNCVALQHLSAGFGNGSGYDDKLFQSLADHAVMNKRLQFSEPKIQGILSIGLEKIWHH